MAKESCIENRTLDELSIGDEASLSRTLAWRANLAEVEAILARRPQPCWRNRSPRHLHSIRSRKYLPRPIRPTADGVSRVMSSFVRLCRALSGAKRRG
jgi:hypothetical protein